jgi:hypothetical protein
MPILEPLLERVESQQRDLSSRLRAGRVLPVVGASLSYSLLFAPGTGDEAPIREEEIAQAWAEQLGLPLPASASVARVARYASYRSPDYFDTKQSHLKFLTSFLLALAQDDPAVPRDAIEEVAALHDTHPFTECARMLGYPRRAEPTRDPLLLLADLRLPIYVTTSFHLFLQHALQMAGKTPRTAICRWNEAAREIIRPEHRFDPDYRPTVEAPLVFHIYGHEEYPASLVLSEDDYLSFLESVARNTGRDAYDPMIPLAVLGAWASSSLLYLDFRPDSLEFKALCTGLSSPSRKRSRGTFVCAEIPAGIPKEEEFRQYIVQYLRDRELDVYWGTTSELLSSLR